MNIKYRFKSQYLWGWVTKLKDLLSKIRKDYFYLMHLSYNDMPSREPLWRYAYDKRRIGLDYPGIDKNWSNIPQRKREKVLNWFWRHQFELFCEKMDKGDCVLVMEGLSRLLGVGLVGEPYSFKEIRESKRYPKGFFRHVRPVRWLIKYKYEERVPFRVPKFTNTIAYVDSSRSRWAIVDRELEIKTINPQVVRRAKNAIRKAESKYYHEGGLREILTEISTRNPKLIQDARDKYGTKCKICGFDFEEKYDELGCGFIEVHHLKPLSKRKRKITPTKLKDVIVCCSNCHRMIHRKRPPITPAKLKSMIRK